MFLASIALASEPAIPPEHAKFFESKVRPLLNQHCFKCHGPDKQQGDLRLDSRSEMLRGGESGAAIVPGNPAESMLIDAVEYNSFEMPPDGKLADADIAILRRWIEIGAPWPGDKPGTVRTKREKISAEDRAWWAFQPVKEPKVPEISGDTWSRNPIDKFILEKLRAEKLTPSGEADRVALVRRLYFDLIGLPPTPEEIEAFVNDKAPDAYEKHVDALLAKPEYGERWARHWLDLVRYADSDGYRIDHFRPYAFRYRDYVIRSLNEDKPYDRFVQEQLAGDELFPGDPQALAATGFLRHGIYEYNNRDVVGQWTTMLNDITNTTADVFLGLGLQCAQCHDHKYDPILQQDYYRLQAFFGGLKPRDDLTATTEKEREDYAKKLAAWEAETAEMRSQIDAIEAPYRKKARESAITKFPEDIQKVMLKEPAQRTPLEQQLSDLAFRQVDYEYVRLDDYIKGEPKEKRLALKKKLAEHDKKRPEPLPFVLAATDVGKNAAPTTIPKKGDGDIAPGFVTLLEEGPANIPSLPDGIASTGRRAALANWLTQADNVLTSRVIANRIWQYHFGRGLAPNSSDFGKLGGPPTHPELLDWLAVRFVKDGWSWKKLHRLILMSATWRQAPTSESFAAQQQRDPTNKFYWRSDTRRLDAEQIRDAILSISGELDRTHYGPAVTSEIPRRSIYLRYMRNARDPLLDVFDLPLFFASSNTRDTTTTPIQSLLLINSQAMYRLATRFADSVCRDAKDPGERVETAWQRAYGRLPTAEEKSACAKFIAAQTKLVAARTGQIEPQDLATSKLPYRDGQAVVIDAEKKDMHLTVPSRPQIPAEDFTVEAFFLLRSVYETGAVRGIISKRKGDPKNPGWAFGVTGKGSRRKPQTLVMQIYGTKMDGKFGEAAIFSDQNIQFNTPYYAAAAVRLAKNGKPGEVAFYLKDLSNDDEPLLTAVLPLDIVNGMNNEEPLSIGATGSVKPQVFDGLIDDVRISKGALPVNKLLFTSEATSSETVGYWQFEPASGIFSDVSGQELDIQPSTAAKSNVDAARVAFTDFCHGLLNSNEFLYSP